MHIFSLIVCTALVGCAAKPLILPKTDFPITVRVDPSLPKWGESRAYYRDGKIQRCEIILKRENVCLLHEVRHCLEGDWHPRNEPNTEDC